MNQPHSPFSKQELIPQEETLEIDHKRGSLFIGIPKENHQKEKRVCLTPDAVNAVVANGHQVMIESGAGNGAQYSDLEYTNAGAILTKDTKKVFSCPFILKMEPPSLEEIAMMHTNTIVISALQIKTQQEHYFKALSEKRITALGFEYIKDKDGTYPAVRALSEIAGTASVLIASELLAETNRGNGLLFGNISGVPPVEVVIIGAGTVGEFAAKSALGLGANIKVFDSSITKLRAIQNNLNARFYTSTIQPKNLLKSLKRCDVVIGATRGTDRAPVVVSESMVENMKKGSVIIDVSIDMGGCFETSVLTDHQNPVVEKYGVKHYGVPNIPSRYPRTSSISVSNIFTPYLLEIGENGGLEQSIKLNQGLRNGVYMYHGILTNKSIGEWFGMHHSDVNFLIF